MTGRSADRRAAPGCAASHARRAAVRVEAASATPTGGPMPTRPSVPSDFEQGRDDALDLGFDDKQPGVLRRDLGADGVRCGAPSLLHRGEQPVPRAVRDQHAYRAPGAEGHGRQGSSVASSRRRTRSASASGTASSGRSRSSSTRDTACVSTSRSGTDNGWARPRASQPSRATGRSPTGWTSVQPVGVGLAHRPPTAATEQRLQPLRQRPGGAGPGLLPPGAIAEVDAGGELAGKRADHRVYASSDRGPAQGSLLVHRLGQPQSAKLSETVGDGLRDSDERSGQGHLHQRQVHGLARAADAGGHPGMPETGAESQSGRAGLDQPVDVRRLARGRARQPQARRQHQLAAVQEGRRVVELDGVCPGEVGVAVADVHRPQVERRAPKQPAQRHRLGDFAVVVQSGRSVSIH